ncbi:MAG TPA: spore coat U domain-containing protein [Rhizomicrobium sp.]|jgi:spore coat protein U-like protein
MPKSLRMALAVLVGLIAADAAPAATQSTTFSVTATVLGSCSVSAGTLAFGSYTPTAGSSTDASSTVNVVCTNGTDYTVALDGGSTANNVAAREMNDAASHTLSYEIYKDSARATVWGDGTGASVTQSGTGGGATQSFTAYGRVPAAQFVTAGNYADTVTVTVSY